MSNLFCSGVDIKDYFIISNLFCSGVVIKDDYFIMSNLFCSGVDMKDYSRLSLSGPRLSRITAYLEVKFWSLF